MTDSTNTDATQSASLVMIRLATRTDLSTVLNLIALLDPPDAPRIDQDVAESIFATMSDYPSYRVWLAEVDGVAVGTYALLIMDNLGHRGVPAAIVENVAVTAESRGLGVGRAMMEHARERARARGCYKLVLSSNVVRTEAHAFYEHLGFERHGISFRITP